MNEKRLQQYLELIEQLLSLSTDEEINQILVENKNLLDVGFLQTIAIEVEKAFNEGDESKANRLRYLFNARDKALNSSPNVPKASPIIDIKQSLESLKEPEFQPYGQFLAEVLQANYESKGDAQVVYSLLEANIDKLDANLAEVLRRWATSIFEEVEVEEAKTIANVIGKFSNLISDFPLGNKANNMEIVIIGYEVILTILTKDTSPEIWAMTQNNLGNIYSDRIKGDKAENIENAIAAYNAALEIHTRNQFPYGWADTQNSLGNAYRERIKGDKAENIENAIAAYNAALEIDIRNQFPYGWATTQYNLGNAYRERIKGDKADNIEKAIAAYNAALEIYTRKDFPQNWATTQNSLGVAYIERIKGDKVENIEKAIAAYNVALEIHTHKDFPQNWAMTQNNLGVAYWQRIKGDKADNIENAITSFEAALETRTRKDFPKYWADAQYSLGIIYLERIKGEKADNIENAITSFEAALETRTRKDFPKNWADVQYNLGVAYRDRIKGNKAENIEKAILCFQHALEVYTRKDFPKNWAMTQNNLGNAYQNRIEGDKADSIEKAIACYETALEVYTYKDLPQDWAATQNSLGIAYWERIKEDKAENIEKAIACYEAALEVYTCKDLPQDWAMTQNNLGNAYKERIKGDKVENIEKAIISFKTALEIRTRNDFPEYWAMTQNNLGIAYMVRITGDKAENIENAITSFKTALEVYTHNKFPYEWATTQNNLGNAYRERITGDKAENIEKAIISFKTALEVYTHNKFPYEWARAQNNLGNAYRDRIKGDKEDNIKNAITSFKTALEVYTRNHFPYEWAATQNNLGIAYWQGIKRDKPDNIEKTIASFKAALEVRTPTALPIECLQTARNLGNLLFEIERWQEAINAYDKAIQAVELTRSWAAYDSRRQEILEDAFGVYANIIQACINNQQPALAIEYAERSKARNLVELLATRDLYPKGNIPQEIINELDRLRKEIRVEQTYLSRQTKSQLQSGNKDENQIKAENQKWEESRQNLEQLQQQLDELITNKIQPIDPSFSLTQKVESIKFKEIQSLLDERTAIIEWYITTEKIITFIVTPKAPFLFFDKRGININIWESQPEDKKALIEWKDKYLEDYEKEKEYKNQQWQNSLEKKLKKLAKILHIDELIAQIPKDCDKLILIPHQLLHIFPLHALEVKSDESSIKKCLFELFSGGVKYAPSCQLLQLAQTQQVNDFTSLFAIQEPKNRFSSLPFANVEVEVIRSFFSDADVLTKEKATLSALINNKNRESAHCIHFSCHGDFNVEQPLESAVFLANNDFLTLGNLFARDLDLNQCHLVVLSACETGLIDANNISDEYIGLPSGFLFAGSSSVISSQWTVDDLATAFLLIKFYSNLKNISTIGEGDIAVALKDAQIWLRNLKSEEGEKFLLEKIIPHVDKIFSNKPRTAKSLKQAAYSRIRKERLPFANPAYWAAFITTGF